MIMENFERHNNALRKATLHADRVLSKAERDAQSESRDSVVEKFRCVREEVRKQCHAVSLRMQRLFFFVAPTQSPGAVMTKIVSPRDTRACRKVG
jgi:hypothetical protein